MSDVLNEIVVSDTMVKEAVRVLRASGAVEYDCFITEGLMRQVLWCALAEDAIQRKYGNRPIYP